MVLVPSLRLGGAEIQAVENALVLRAIGLRVVFCTVYNPIADYFFFRVDEMRDRGIEIRSLSSETTPGHPLGVVKGLFRFMQLRRRLRQIITECSPDYAYTRLWYSSLLMRCAMTKNRPPATATIFNEETTLSAVASGRVKAGIRKWLLRQADAWIVPCNGLFRQAIAEGCPASSGHVFPNLPNAAIADQCQQASSGGNVIGFLGRLMWQKGVDRLCAVARAYLPGHPSDCMRIAGDGPEGAAIRRELADSISAGQVVLTGARRNVGEFLDGISVLILTSYFEGFANVIVEAFARGKPVVAFDVDFGPRDLIDPGKTGFLIPDGDVCRMAAVLTEQRGKWHELSRACIEAAKERYSRNAQAARWVALLEKLDASR